MSGLRFVLIGTVQLTEGVLEAMSEAGAEIAAVVSLRPEVGQIRHSDYVDLAPICSRLGIECHQIGKNDEIDLNLLSHLEPDVLLVFGWSRLISSDVIALARLGAIGFHPAPLPIGRGRHPLIWTILLGLKRRAVCFFRLESGADCGDIILKREYALADCETAATLMSKVISEARAAVPTLLGRLRADGVNGTPQDNAAAVVWRKRDKKDGIIDFRMSATLVDRHVRALSQPYPGADAVHSGHGLQKIWAVEWTKLDGSEMFVEPGVIVGRNSGDPIVSCGEDAVILRKHGFSKPLDLGSRFL